MIEKLDQGSQTQVVGSAAAVQEAFEKIITLNPEALLLDIKLLGGDAFQLLQKLRDQRISIPPTVIITGHLDFELAQETINRFRHEVVHMLQKPFLDNWEEKYRKICSSVRSNLQANELKSSKTQEVLFLRSGNTTHRANVQDIKYIQVGGQGTSVLYLDDNREIRIYKTLVKLIDELPPTIVRIHRKFAIHRHKVSHIDHEDRMIYLKGMRRGIDIGEVYYPRMVELLQGSS